MNWTLGLSGAFQYGAGLGKRDPSYTASWNISTAYSTCALRLPLNSSCTANTIAWSELLCELGVGMGVIVVTLPLPIARHVSQYIVLVVLVVASAVKVAGCLSDEGQNR